MGSRLEIRPGFVFLLCACAYFGSPALVGVFLLAAVCHELGHILMARLLGLRLGKLTLSAAGAELRLRQNAAYWQDVLLCLAGPSVNLALTKTAFPLFSGANLLLGLFNLLPVRGLDGGNALFAVFSMLLGSVRAERVLRWMSRVFAAGVVLLGIFVVVLPGGNPRLLLLGLWLFVISLK